MVETDPTTWTSKLAPVPALSAATEVCGLELVVPRSTNTKCWAASSVRLPGCDLCSMDEGLDAESGRAAVIAAESEEAACHERPRQPAEPTEEEIRAPTDTHEPYRSWCPSCVAGQDGHSEHDHSQNILTIVGMDDGILGAGVEATLDT